MKLKGVAAKELLKKPKGKMNVETLRSYPGFKNISDEDGEYVLKTIGTLAKIIIKTTPALIIKKEAEVAKLKK